MALAVEKINGINALRDAVSTLNVNQKEAVFVPATNDFVAFVFNMFFPLPFEAEYTYAMIKPDAVEHEIEITADIIRFGFTIVATKKFRFNRAECEEFYGELRNAVNRTTNAPIFPPLVDFMLSGPCVGFLLSRPKAISAWRKLIGPTDPSAARAMKPTSIRARFGSGLPTNACHGSDSPSSVSREVKLVFKNDLEGINLQESTPLSTNDELNTILIDGLAEMCRKKPVGSDAVRFLAKYLEDHNSRKPKIEEPEC